MTGNNKSSHYLTLIPEIPYEHYNYKTGNFEGAKYTFNVNGTYYKEDSQGILSNGTYTYDGCTIKTSEGETLTFMVIDGISMGYVAE